MQRQEVDILGMMFKSIGFGAALLREVRTSEARKNIL
jgi:hypothetical protein